MKTPVSAMSLVVCAAVGGCSSPTEPPAPDRPPEIEIEGPVLQVQSVRARRADDFVNTIGLNVHLSYFRSPYGTAWNTVVKPKLVELGVRHLRDGGVVERSDRWMRVVYGRMRELAHHGMRFNLVMRPPEGSARYDTIDHLDRLLAYADGVIESFEGLNEHDFSGRPGWAAEVRAFQHALYTRVKADPRTARMRVFGPSIGEPRNHAAVGDLSRSMDYGPLHPYPGGREPMATIGRHETAARAVFGSKPIVVTESGYHTALDWRGLHPPVSERAMGQYTLRLLFEHFAAGIPRTYLYELIDQGQARHDKEQNFGLLRFDGTEKPAYRGLRNLIDILADPGPPAATGHLAYQLGGDTTGVSHTVLQKRDGRFYLVLWHAAPSYDLVIGNDERRADRPVRVTVPAGSRVLMFQPLWSASPIKELRPAAPFDIGVPNTPLLLEVTVAPAR